MQPPTYKPLRPERRGHSTSFDSQYSAETQRFCCRSRGCVVLFSCANPLHAASRQRSRQLKNVWRISICREIVKCKPEIFLKALPIPVKRSRVDLCSYRPARCVYSAGSNFSLGAPKSDGAGSPRPLWNDASACRARFITQAAWKAS